MKRFKAVVLDMDGTLVNTERLWKIAETELLLAHGRQYDPIVHSQFLGLSLEDFIEAVRQGYGLMHVDAAVLAEELENLAYTLLETRTEPNTGAVALTRYLVEHDIPCAIASNSSRSLIRATLRNQRWADVVPARYSSDDVRNAKPAPDLYLYVAKQLQVEPADCLAVEDSLTGVQAAVEAGMTCLAVPEGDAVDVRSYQSLTPYVFHTLNDVLYFIQKS